MRGSAVWPFDTIKSFNNWNHCPFSSLFICREPSDSKGNLAAHNNTKVSKVRSGSQFSELTSSRASFSTACLVGMSQAGSGWPPAHPYNDITHILYQAGLLTKSALVQVGILEGSLPLLPSLCLPSLCPPFSSFLHLLLPFLLPSIFLFWL